MRKKGYSVDYGAEFEGLHCIAAPVLNYYGYPVASVWITGPAKRMPKTKFVELGKIVSRNAAIICKESFSLRAYKWENINRIQRGNFKPQRNNKQAKES